LIIDALERDPHVHTRIIGSVRAGGHPVELVLDFANPIVGAAEYIEVPWLLAIHPPSQQAVVSMLRRANAGERLTLPLDLTDVVAGADPPCPWAPADPATLARLNSAADRVDLRAEHLEHAGHEPVWIHGTLLVDGRQIHVNAEAYPTPGAFPIVHWRGATPLDSLTPDQRYAVLRLVAHP
jgi:hypothetical protein